MNTQTIESNTRLERHPDLVSTQVEGEEIILSIENGQYYGLNDVATRIWELLKSPLAFEELLTQLQSEYDVTPDQCQSDTLTLLNKLQDESLITCG